MDEMPASVCPHRLGTSARHRPPGRTTTFYSDGRKILKRKSGVLLMLADYFGAGVIRIVFENSSLILLETSVIMVKSSRQRARPFLVQTPVPDRRSIPTPAARTSSIRFTDLMFPPEASQPPRLNEGRLVEART